MEDTREEAEGLSNKCLLQDMGGHRYRAHDLLLEFVKIKINQMMERATQRQAQYLRRLDVVNGYANSEHGAGDQGFFFLAALLWRSVEKLSGNLELEVASYPSFKSGGVGIICDERRGGTFVLAYRTSLRAPGKVGVRLLLSVLVMISLKRLGKGVSVHALGQRLSFTSHAPLDVSEPLLSGVS